MPNFLDTASVNRGVPHHQRDAARIGAQVHRRQVGVTGDGADVHRIDAEHFRHARHEHIVGALSDFRRAAEGGDAAAAIQLELYSRMRHIVPVDRQPGPGEVRGAAEADTAAEWKLPERLGPVCRVRDATDALRETDGADTQVVRGKRLWLLDDPETEVGGIEGQPLRDLVELNLLPETALRCAVASLGSARRLVGEHTAALKLVGRDVVGDGLKCARVERAGDAVGTVGTAVEHGLHVHAGDAAVLLDAGREPHQYWMATAVAVEYFLAREADLHGPIEHQGGLTDDQFVVERIALSAEPAPVWRRDDADMCRGHRERFGQRAMNVVRCLGAGPQHQLAVLVLRRHRCVLFDRQVCVAFVEEGVVEDVIRGGERCPHVPEAQRHQLVDVATVAVLVNPGRLVLEAVIGIAERPQRLVLDVDEVERLERRELVASDHRRHRVADEPHAVDRERVLVLADRQNAVRDREVLAGEHEVDAGMRQRA